jgi:hypothetical protein
MRRLKTTRSWIWLSSSDAPGMVELRLTEEQYISLIASLRR